VRIEPVAATLNDAKSKCVSNIAIVHLPDCEFPSSETLVSTKTGADNEPL